MIGLLQLATVAAIHFYAADQLPALAQRVFAAELAEDPNDFLAARIISLAGMAPTSQLAFDVLCFAANELLHVGIVVALLFSVPVASPAAVLVLAAAFLLYQLVEWLSAGGRGYCC